MPFFYNDRKSRTIEKEQSKTSTTLFSNARSAQLAAEQEARRAEEIERENAPDLRDITNDRALRLFITKLRTVERRQKTREQAQANLAAWRAAPQRPFTLSQRVFMFIMGISGHPFRVSETEAQKAKRIAQEEKEADLARLHQLWDDWQDRCNEESGTPKHLQEYESHYQCDDDVDTGIGDPMDRIFEQGVIPHMQRSERIRDEREYTRREKDRYRYTPPSRSCIRYNDTTLLKVDDTSVATGVNLTVKTLASGKENDITIGFYSGLDDASEEKLINIQTGKSVVEGKEQLQEVLSRATTHAPELAKRVTGALNEMASQSGPVEVVRAEITTSIVSSTGKHHFLPTLLSTTASPYTSNVQAAALYSKGSQKSRNDERHNQIAKPYTQHGQSLITHMNTKGVTQDSIAYPVQTASSSDNDRIVHTGNASGVVFSALVHAPMQGQGNASNPATHPATALSNQTIAPDTPSSGVARPAASNDLAIANEPVPYESVYPGDPITDPFEDGYELEFARKLNVLMPDRFVLRKINKGFALVTQDITVQEGKVARTPGLALGHYISTAVFIAFKGGEIQTTISEDNRHIVISSNEDKINKKIANAVDSVASLRTLITDRLAILGDQKAHRHRRRMYTAALRTLNDPAFENTTIHVPLDPTDRDRHAELRNMDYAMKWELGTMRLPAGLKRPCFACAMVLEENAMLADRPVGYLWFGEGSFLKPLGLGALPTLPSKKELKRQGISDADAQKNLRHEISERAKADAQTFASKLQKLELRRAFKTEMTKPQFSSKYGTDEPWSEDETETEVAIGAKAGVETDHNDPDAEQDPKLM